MQWDFCPDVLTLQRGDKLAQKQRGGSSMQATPSISISVPERARRNCRHLYSVYCSSLIHEMILNQGCDNCLAHHGIFSRINQESSFAHKRHFRDSPQMLPIIDSPQTHFVSFAKLE